MYSLLDKHRLVLRKLKKQTNYIFEHLNKTTFRLDNTLGEKSYISFNSISKTLGLRQLCQDQFVVPVIPMKTGPFNKDAHNLYSRKTNNATMLQLSKDGRLQHA